MTTFLLIRHAACDPLGRLIAGRAPGVHLNPAGREQAAAMAERLRETSLEAIYSSPLERALETAEPLARARGLTVERVDAFNEVDFGEWTGRSLAELEATPGWREFNTFRSGTRIPGGELMLEVQVRAVEALMRLARSHPDRHVAVVTHGDVIRAILVYSLGMPLDLLLRIELAPASVSAVRIEEQGIEVLSINSAQLPWWGK